LVLGLVILAWVLPPPASTEIPASVWTGVSFWGMAHGILVILAAVGISVGFVASVMYFVQAHRLRAKLPPSPGMKMLSLERIETMQRRAILWAFPLLTVGLLVGLVLLAHQGATPPTPPLPKGGTEGGWLSPVVLSTFGLWLVFAVLLYLRYGVHVRGKQAAAWTMVAFAFLIVSLVSLAMSSSVHPLLGGGP